MPDDIEISDAISIPVSEIEIAAVRAQGSGGQNVNKVASAIHLRCDIANSESLPDRIRDRLLAMSDHRITEDGVLVIKSQEHRTQERNRRAAIERLTRFVQSALVEKKPRKKTRPSKQVKRKRLDEKRRRGAVKRSRSNVGDDS